MAIIFNERLHGWRFVLFNAVLAFGHMAVLFNAGSYIALMPHVAGDLGGVKPSFGTWAQTDFMIALALGFPLSRRLSGKYGTCAVWVAAFVAYALASYLCAISETLWLFLPARILLGIVGGLTLPVGQSLLLEEYPDHLKLLGLGMWGLISMMPFTISFSVGGIIADEFGWRSLFYLNIPVALIVAAITGALLAGREYERSYIRFDAVGFVLLAVVLGGIQTILNQGNDFDWLDSVFLRVVLALVIAALILFVVWELGERHPVLDIRLFSHGSFAIGVLASTVGFLLIQGILSLFIVQLQVLLGYSSFLASMVFLPMIVLAVPVAIAMHVMALEWDARWLVCLNFLGFAGVWYWLGLFDDSGSFDQVFWPMLLLGCCLGSFFVPLTRLTVHGLSGRQERRAAEETGLLRIVAGAFGITLQGVLFFRRTPFHQLHLADNFGGRRFASLNLLQEFSLRLKSAGVAPEAINHEFALFIKKQAAILAMNDTFLLAGYLFAGLAGLIWLAPPAYPSPHPGRRKEIDDIQAEQLMEEP
jgi:DHA2 family multidrug resistance protein